MTFFGGIAIGAAASPSAGVTAMRTLKQEKNAAAAFAFIQANATLPGQLMAMVGLSDVEPKAFQAALPAYAQSKTDVRYWAGGASRHTRPFRTARPRSPMAATPGSWSSDRSFG